MPKKFIWSIIWKPECETKKMNIDIDKSKLIICNCNGLVVPIQLIINKNNVDVKRSIKNDKKIIIPANWVTKMPINFRSTVLIPDKNYLFEPQHENVYTHGAIFLFFCLRKKWFCYPGHIENYGNWYLL